MRVPKLLFLNADVAELADALDLGSSGVTRGGSTPFIRTIFWSHIKQQAGVAQLVEHHVANVIVVGSNPITRSIFFTPNNNGYWLKSLYKRS